MIVIEQQEMEPVLHEHPYSEKGLNWKVQNPLRKNVILNIERNKGVQESSQRDL
jgi:hypothetical protein